MSEFRLVMPTVFEVGFFGRNIPGNNLKEIQLADDAVEFVPGTGYAPPANGSDIEAFASDRTYRYPIDDLEAGFSVAEGMLWATVTVRLKTGGKIVAKGLTNENANEFCKALRLRAWRRDNARTLVAGRGSFELAQVLLDAFLGRDDIISADECAAFLTANRSSLLDCDFDPSLLPADLRDLIARQKQTFAALTERVDRHNDGVLRKRNLDELRLSAALVADAIMRLQAIEASAEYLRASHLAPILASLNSRKSFWNLKLPWNVDADRPLVQDYARVGTFLSDPDLWRSRRNTEYVTAALGRYKAFFDSIVTGGLTEEQRRACLIDDSRTKVVAGAGSGKTTTLFAKAAFLAECQGVAPERILAITYTNKSRDDLRKRFDSRPSLADVRISTIHSLGTVVTAEATGRKPSLVPWVGDDAALAERLDRYVNDAFADEHLRTAMQTVMLFNSRELVPPYAFNSIAQYDDYRRRVKPLSLTGELLKSQQECLIANFLYVNGIPYEYERKYCIDTTSQFHRQYMPDFFLPDAEIYIEHYGVARDGSTGPDIDKEVYAAGMKWKRDLHAQHGTVCLETFSYEAAEGTLVATLEAALRARGVAFAPIPPEQVLEILRKRGRVTEFHRLISRFIALYKERETSADLESIYSADEFSINCVAPTLRYMFERYESDRSKLDSVDFSDMIVSATTVLESREASCPFDVILLDEAQDLSHARSRLVRALCDAGTDVRLTVVGDDWQSIYRFAGSDVLLFADFHRFFGDGPTVDLALTHRFDTGIAAPSSTFICVNSKQTQRPLGARAASDERPRMTVVTSSGGSSGQATDALSILSETWGLQGATVLLIGRTKYDAPRDISALRRAYQCPKIGWVTAHSAKGLEADFAVLVGVNEGWSGFPSVRPDDSIIERLLPKPDEFLNGEERRLFYVAMTRARKAVVLCKALDAPAPFIDEIRASHPEIPEIAGVVGTDHSSLVNCRSCGIGVYVVRDGRAGAFAGCSEYPGCRETAALCLQCEGILDCSEDQFACTTEACDWSAPICPLCGRGWLSERRGPHGTFLGCSRWRRSGDGCSHTQAAS